MQGRLYPPQNGPPFSDSEQVDKGRTLIPICYRQQHREHRLTATYPVADDDLVRGARGARFSSVSYWYCTCFQTMRFGCFLALVTTFGRDEAIQLI